MKTFFFVCLLFLTTLPFTFGQGYEASIIEFQKELNHDYLNPKKSPLTSDQRTLFDGHPFYPINQKYAVKAKLIRTKDAPAFEMKTSTDRLPIYRKYGVVEFYLDSVLVRLSVLQSDHALSNEDAKNDLFLPFTDLTNGISTYGGGRYLDLKIPEGDSILVDFNKAYQPFCAYNYGYSCPIPPTENAIDLEIEAGVANLELKTYEALLEEDFNIRFSKKLCVTLMEDEAAYSLEYAQQEANKIIQTDSALLASYEAELETLTFLVHDAEKKYNNFMNSYSRLYCPVIQKAFDKNDEAYQIDSLNRKAYLKNKALFYALVNQDDIETLLPYFEVKDEELLKEDLEKLKVGLAKYKLRTFFNIRKLNLEDITFLNFLCDYRTVDFKLTARFIFDEKGEKIVKYLFGFGEVFIDRSDLK